MPLINTGELPQKVLKPLNAAISIGFVQEQPVLDLKHVEYRQAEEDLNIVMTCKEDIIEVQNTADN